MAVKDARTSATKLTLLLINFFFMALGIAAIATGAWVLLNNERMQPLTWFMIVDNNLGMLQSAAVVLIVAGSFVFTLSILGCCGTCREIKCLLGLFIGILALAVILTIAACVVAFIYREKIEDELLSDLNTNLVHEYEGYSTSQNKLSQALDYAQVKFECCGVESYTEYDQAEKWTARAPFRVPISCCMLDRDAYLNDNYYILRNISCPAYPNLNNSNIGTACYGKVKEWMEQQATAMGGISVTLIGLEILAILFAVVLILPRRKNANNLYRR